MAKRVKTTTVKEELPEELQAESVVDMSGDLSNLGKLLEQFEESGLTVEVYKDELGHWDYCETIRGTNQIDKDAIRDTWGGGRFELRIHENGVLETTVTFRVAKRQGPPTQANGNQTAENLLREQNMFFQKMLMTLMMRDNKSPAATAEGLSIKDIIAIFTTANSAPVDTLIKGMELSKTLSGSGASSDWKAEAIHTVAELGKTIIPSVVQIAAASRPNGNGNPHMSQISVLPDDLLKQGISELKKKVLQGLPVNLVLDWIIGNANEYQHIIKGMLERGYDSLETLDGELKNEPFKTWFKTLYDGLKHVYTANSNDEDSDGESGDMGNVAGNGGIG